MIQDHPPLTVLLAAPRGFCAGVERAIQAVEDALEQTGKPVYVRHEIVHNDRVVDDLKRKGAVFVEESAADPRRGRRDFQRPWRVARGGARGGRTRPLRARCHLPARAPRSSRRAAPCEGRAGGHRHRPSRPCGGRGHDRADRRQRARDRERGGGADRACRGSRSASPTSLRPRCRWTIPARSSRL